MSKVPERRRADAALSRLETAIAGFEAHYVGQQARAKGGKGEAGAGEREKRDHNIQRKVYHALGDLRLALSVLCERLEAAREQKAAAKARSRWEQERDRKRREQRGALSKKESDALQQRERERRNAERKEEREGKASTERLVQRVCAALKMILTGNFSKRLLSAPIQRHLAASYALLLSTDAARLRALPDCLAGWHGLVFGLWS